MSYFGVHIALLAVAAQVEIESKALKQFIIFQL